MARGGFRLKVGGLKEVERKLRTLEPKVAKKVLRQALRKAAKLIQADAVANAPVGETGLLSRSIKVRAGKRTRKKKIQVDVRVGEGDFQGEAFYGAFQEFGTSEIPAKGYMRRAFDAKGPAAARQIVADIRAGVEREANSGG